MTKTQEQIDSFVRESLGIMPNTIIGNAPNGSEKQAKGMTELDIWAEKNGQAERISRGYRPYKPNRPMNVHRIRS